MMNDSLEGLSLRKRILNQLFKEEEHDLKDLEGINAEYGVEKLYQSNSIKEKPFPYSLLDSNDTVVVREYYYNVDDYGNDKIILYNISPSSIMTDKAYNSLEMAIHKWNEDNKAKIKDSIIIANVLITVILLPIVILLIISGLFPVISIFSLLIMIVPLSLSNKICEKIFKNKIEQYSKSLKNNFSDKTKDNLRRNANLKIPDKVNNIVSKDKKITSIQEDLNDIKGALKLIKDKTFVGKARVGLEYCNKTLQYLETNQNKVPINDFKKNVSKLKKLIFLQLDTQAYDSKENEKIVKKSFEILAGINNLLSDSYHEMIDGRKEDTMIQLEMMEMEMKMDKDYMDIIK